MRSLLARITLLAQLSAIVVMVAFGLTSLVLTTQLLERERRDFVTKTAERLARSMDDELQETGDTLVAARGVVEDGVQSGVRVELRAGDGRLLATSHPTRTGAPPAVSPPERSRAPWTATALSHCGVRVVVTTTEATRPTSATDLSWALFVAAIPILILQLILARIVVAQALRPLSSMTKRASSLASETRPRTLGTGPGLEEIDRLASAFDLLLGRLDDALQAERRLSADASHELRTPLTVLGGELDMLIEQSTPGSEPWLGLSRAAEQVAEMRELVEAILLLHRSAGAETARGVDYELVNLCDLARETVAETRARHPGRSDDLRLVAPDEILVTGHASLLASALRNLLDNALKFTPLGAGVEVEVREDQDGASITVDDQGTGIREEERERIFDPFYRGAEARAGLSGFGLGLPILRRVARAHGGDVEVAASARGGARFRLVLPQVRNA